MSPRLKARPMSAHSKGAWHGRKQIPPPVTLATAKKQTAGRL